MRVTISWPRKSDPRSNVLDCFKQVITAVSQEWAKNILWNQKVMNVHTYVKCLWMYSPFCWFLGPYSHHHLTKIIVFVASVDLECSQGKLSGEDVLEFSGSWLFLSLANEFVTNIKWGEQLRTVVNIYCKTSSPPNFLSYFQSTDVAKTTYKWFTFQCTGLFKTSGYRSQPRMSQKHSVEPKGHKGALIRWLLVNVLAFLRISLTLQSPPPDENHYHL